MSWNGKGDHLENVISIDSNSELTLIKKTFFYNKIFVFAVRVPVVLVAANGDLEILSHIARAVQCNISVVVMKGSGGVSDLIAMCIEE